MKTLLLAGATGSTGSRVLALALQDDRFDKVIVLVRKSLTLRHAKLEQWMAPGDDLLAALRNEPVHAIVCCLGTTIKAVGGDRTRFVHVDRDLVVGLGAWAARQHVPVFAVVSAIGADPKSGVFYSRVKGEMEAALRALALPRLHVFHPSILTGKRAEFRLGERIGIAVMTLLQPLFFGTLARYKPMPVHVLAAAMLNAVRQADGGPAVQVHAYAEIKKLAAR